MVELAGVPEATAPREVASVTLPTRAGVFEARAFECASGYVYIALVRGDVAGEDVLTRLHSECLTGDALGSLRCDCGVQLQAALRRVAAEGRGVLVYATGHEGRGIGLVNKLLAYVEQDAGADTLDANVRLGLAVDARDYGDAAAVLAALGVRSVRLLTNNPAKVAALRTAGLPVPTVEPLPTAPHARNLAYLRTKGERLGHDAPTGERAHAAVLPALDVSTLLGAVRPRAERPYVALKYAQTLDGRIATVSGDARWISGERERRVSHALRAACDAVLVGIGTVLRDDPRLTVRMVEGASPRRVVLDSRLRVPDDAHVLSDESATTILTTDRADERRCDELRRRGIDVRLVPSADGRVDVAAALSDLRAAGVTSLLVEGGARVITSLLHAAVVDRLLVGIAPAILGAGTDAVGNLGTERVTDAIRLTDRVVSALDDDLLVAGDVVP